MFAKQHRAPSKTAVPAVLASIGLIYTFGCHQPAAQVATPRAPAVSAASQKPDISYFNAEPQTVTVGQTLSLRWSTLNATGVEILPEIGPVQANDARVISPAQTTTYTLKASNQAGSVEASVTVTVTRPPPPVRASEEGPSGINLLNGQLSDIHFDYNEANLKEEDRAILESDASLLLNLFQLDTSAHVTVEGHCDDRGSDEFNVALGDRRATAVKEALVKLGVPAEKLDVISFGKERPLCLASTDECYAKNRRAHFSTSHKAPNRIASIPQ